MIVPPAGREGIRRGMVIFQRRGEPTGEILKWVIFHRGHGQLLKEMSRSGMYFSAKFNIARADASINIPIAPVKNVTR